MSGYDRIYYKVAESYENAIDNGYDVDSMDIHDLASDMIEYDSDLENCNIEDIINAINKYRNS